MDREEIKNELLFDFGICLPRVLATVNSVVLDNIKQLVLITDEQVTVNNGLGFTSVYGNEMIIRELGNERMLVTGKIQKIEFYGAK